MTEYHRLRLTPPHLYATIQFPVHLDEQHATIFTKRFGDALQTKIIPYDQAFTIGANYMEVRIPDGESFYPTLKLVERLYNQTIQEQKQWESPLQVETVQ